MHYAVRRVFTGASPPIELARLLAHDHLYQDPNRLVTFVDLHDVARFMNEPGATADGLARVFTFLMTARGIPMIYYGDEIAMPGGKDPDNRRDFPGGWKEDPRDAFQSTGRTAGQQSLFEHVRRLARLRADLEPLRRGAMLDLLADEHAYAFARVTPRSSVLVVFNGSAEPAALRVLTNGVPILQ